MPKLCFAILAHNNRPCLEDLVLNLRAFVPTADVVLFNGGKDASLADGLDVETCPYSRPLEYECLVPFHLGVMRWLHEQARPYDFLITLDSDMLFVKSGFETYLETAMADSAYMAVLFREVTPRLNWITGRRFRSKWQRVWQPIFGTPNPYGCFNPGQAFRKEFADRLLRFPRLHELQQRIERSSLYHLEEMVWPTLAVTLECAPKEYAISARSAVRYVKRHSPAEIRGYLADPDVFFIHPVSMRLDAPERQVVRLLRDGRAVDFAAFEREFESLKVPVPLKQRLRTSLVTPVLSKLNDAYLRLVPE